MKSSVLRLVCPANFVLLQDSLTIALTQLLNPPRLGSTGIRCAVTVGESDRQQFLQPQTQPATFRYFQASIVQMFLLPSPSVSGDRRPVLLLTQSKRDLLFGVSFPFHRTRPFLKNVSYQKTHIPAGSRNGVKVSCFLLIENPSPIWLWIFITHGSAFGEQSTANGH